MKKIDLDNFLVDIKDEANTPYLGPFLLWFRRYKECMTGIYTKEFTDTYYGKINKEVVEFDAFHKSYDDLSIYIKNNITPLSELYNQYPELFGEDNFEPPCYKDDMVYAYLKEFDKLISCHSGYKVRFTGGYDNNNKPIVEFQSVPIQGIEKTLCAVDIISHTPLLTTEEQIKEYVDNKNKTKSHVVVSEILGIINRNSIKMPTMQEVEKISLEKSEKGWTGLGHTFEVVRHFIEEKQNKKFK